jgi:PIN domain nuclease of toxin-antitoxin system
MIVLDTHAWVWWATESKQLSTRARRAITDTDELGVSVISCWEVAMLVEKGRLGFNQSCELWIERALEFPQLKLLPLTPAIATMAARLSAPFHGDPADRIIAATCLRIEAQLVTKDRELRRWRHLKTIW